MVVVEKESAALGQDDLSGVAVADGIKGYFVVFGHFELSLSGICRCYGKLKFEPKGIRSPAVTLWLISYIKLDKVSDRSYVIKVAAMGTVKINTTPES